MSRTYLSDWGPDAIAEGWLHLIERTFPGSDVWRLGLWDCRTGGDLVN